MNKSIWQAFGAGVALAAMSVAAHAAGEVKLQQVTSIVSTKYGMSQQGTTFEANVANIAYGKQVYAHYKRGDGTWVDVPLAYNRAAGAGREVWTAPLGLPLNTTLDMQFALRYVVNGQTYWDNNNGSNYFVPKDSGTTLGPGIQVYNLYYQPTARIGAADARVYGTAVVKNLSVTKDVAVLYSTDNWATVKTATASYSPNHWAGAYSSAANPNGAGYEAWAFNLHVGTAATQVDYAVRYTVNGDTFWDNNGGANYRTAIVRQ